MFYVNSRHYARCYFTLSMINQRSVKGCRDYFASDLRGKIAALSGQVSITKTSCVSHSAVPLCAGCCSTAPRSKIGTLSIDNKPGVTCAAHVHVAK